MQNKYRDVLLILDNLFPLIYYSITQSINIQRDHEMHNKPILVSIDGESNLAKQSHLTWEFRVHVSTVCQGLCPDRQQYFKISSKTCWRKKAVGKWDVIRLQAVRYGNNPAHALVRKCWAAAWISFPGLLPCESEAQCLPSEAWLCFRPDGLGWHLRAPLPQSPALFLFSLLSSPPLPHFPSILSLIQTHSPFPFISCCLPLRASQFLISPPPHLPHVPCPPLALSPTFPFSLFALIRLPCSSLFYSL